MEKKWYASKTVWGGLLLGLEAALMKFGGTNIYIDSLLTFLGVALTIYGFRDAMK